MFKKDLTTLMVIVSMALLTACGTAPGHGEDVKCDSTEVSCDTTVCDTVAVSVTPNVTVSATITEGNEVE